MVGFMTRAGLAIRLSFPLENARQAVARFVAVHIAIGLHGGDLACALTELLHRDSSVLSVQFLELIYQPMKNRYISVIVALGR